MLSTRFIKPAVMRLLLCMAGSLCACAGYAQSDTSLYSASRIKKLSIEDLMNIEVTSVSRHAEKLSEVASAIQVITNEDIRRSGATTLPQALRLASNLQVAQYNAYDWVISARGFNNVFANKLLVMIDGRTVYSPLFAGVYWDAQNVMLEDIDRIEVISGPGGTMWGSNAVNGVINIITKKAKESQGLFASVAAGSNLHDQINTRYGGTIGKAISYRVYGMNYALDPTLNANLRQNADNWHLTQGGFRMDYDAGGADQVSLQGNFEGGVEHTNPGPSSFDSQNATAQWSHSFSATSGLQLQAYYDRIWRRDIPSTINDQMENYDIDLQHFFQLGKSHRMLWGAGYRFTRDNSQNTTPIVGFVPAIRNLPLYNAFVQDEMQLIPEALKLTLGTKLLHNVYTGFEWQPSARLTYTAGQNTLWGAVSRAVRTPSRIDVDYRLPTYYLPPDVQHVGGGPDFVSEQLTAFELGYRVQPASDASLSIATFYNVYDDLYSVEPALGTKTYFIQNGMTGNSQGIELSGVFQVYSNWRLRGGYTFFHKNLRDKPGHSFDTTYEGTDPQHQATIQSMLELLPNVQLDVTGRYVSGRPLSVVAGVPAVAAYSNLDVRLAWQVKKLELAIVGQNLVNPSHVEYASFRIPRNIYGQLTIRF